MLLSKAASGFRRSCAIVPRTSPKISGRSEIFEVPARARWSGASSVVRENSHSWDQPYGSDQLAHHAGLSSSSSTSFTLGILRISVRESFHAR